ncbi:MULTISPECIES: SpdA protein [Streptomyces]|uniref:SpdA protein n=1 Tax=Streptomyces lycopersici TaxID=2974589 RepID=UPI0021D3DFED|nr:SpdA protein [Streptomyces sp. NEAU-383]
MSERLNRTMPEPDGTSDGAATVRAVTGMMAAVVSLTFLFGFGNVWNLALRLGVPPWVAPLVAPAVDLSILGLLLGIRYLALHGAPVEQLRPARRLLVLSSGMTLALNTADPLIAGDLGKAAFDAVGPVLLIGWAEVGPGLLHALATTSQPSPAPRPSATPQHGQDPGRTAVPQNDDRATSTSSPLMAGTERHCDGDELLKRARQEDARHWETYQRPISAETLRKRLHIGAARSCMLVTMIRSDTSSRRADQTRGLEGVPG